MYTIYLTTECNFKCTYCYENYENTMNITSNKMMEILKFIFGYQTEGKVEIGFMGGEPLLLKEMIYEAIQFIDKKYADRKVTYYITTNCSLLDSTFIEVAKKHDFRMRLSFDGIRKCHNLNRKAKNGKSYYDIILEQMILIKNSGIPYTVRMTIAANTIPYIYENIRFLHRNGFNNIGMVLDIYMDFTKKLQRDYEKQMKMVAEYYMEQVKNRDSFSIDCIHGKFFGILGDYEPCFAMCGAGKSSFHIMPDGKIYACGYLTNRKEFCIGDITEGIDTNMASEFIEKLFYKANTGCSNCEAQTTCHGMKCGYLNYLTSGYINVPSKLTCVQEKVVYPIAKNVIVNMMKQKDTDIQCLKNYIRFIEQDQTGLSALGERVKQELKVREITNV